MAEMEDPGKVPVSAAGARVRRNYARKASPPDWLKARGEMRRRIREYDWSHHPLGAPEGWPQSLKTVVRMMLDSRYAMWMGWGPELTFFYNDAYARDTLNKKHPWALGRPASEVWAEIWRDIGPRIQRVLSAGEATWDEGLLLFLERSGYPEETYHTFSYSPLYDDADNLGGMLCVVTEETKRVISERRLALLRELGANTTAARTVEEASARFVQTLEQNSVDVPFALIYLLDDSRQTFSLKCSVNVSESHCAKFPVISRNEASDELWPLAETLLTQKPVIVQKLQSRFGKFSGGKWPDPPQSAVVLPIPGADVESPFGALVFGINPRRALDDDYIGFFQLVAGQFATALSNARSYEKERQRAEALAELDHAKTTFFSNVSHEFRTPLTLMLGPLEQMLQENRSMPGEARDQLEVVHRNSLRLLKLVNTLLDFSRLEAGRVQPSFEPVELPTFTRDLASAFRSTMENAGLQFHVQCDPIPERVFVDRDMWEKILFNLLSNAFKFTFQGSVTVRLSGEKSDALLRVSDTGTGIPAVELPNVFKRFHRVQNAQARTHEGTGIGLALVHELVKLHGGSISVESKHGEGTAFAVRIPLGKDHLPADRIGVVRKQAATALSGDVFIEEAAHWMTGKRSDAPAGTAPDPRPATTPGRLSRVLVVDDNADMRDYVSRLLRDRYELMTAVDGEEALAAARANKPDLVLSDVMMPKMDGFALLRAIRADRILRTLPVIFLSARAGDEARVEGVEHGADDYLVKPFSGRELLARVQTHLKLARIRDQMNLELERRVEERTASLRDAIAQMEEFSYSVSHDLRSPVRAMHGYAQAMKEDYGDKIDKQGNEYLDRIVQGASRMDRLIRDILTYSRVSRRDVQLEPVALDRLVRDVVEQYPEFAADKAKIVIEGKLPPVVAHEPSLSQVLSNLLSNAVKFVAPGVGPSVLIRSENLDGQVRLWIEDNGIGIKPEHQGRLFGMFERVHPEGKYDGTGIGLAIVRKAVERMGGKVGLESDGVHGSKFWIQLLAV